MGMGISSLGEAGLVIRGRRRHLTWLDEPGLEFPSSGISAVDSLLFFSCDPHDFYRQLENCAPWNFSRADPQCDQAFWMTFGGQGLTVLAVYEGQPRGSSGGMHLVAGTASRVVRSQKEGEAASGL
jgi:hypothetical protein